ncbi:MAG: hypothetical protein HUK04_04155 [Bacteroidaceae bacterium]|nr:hypothetical protein [Bacteroidaceae bacterium]MCF0188666.1 hypothetical protein [Bacteroidaceae bacterium]
MNFKAALASVLAVLGVRDLANSEGRQELTAEQTEKLKSFGFSDEFISNFKTALADGEHGDEGESGATIASLRGTVAQLTTQLMQAQAALNAAQANSESQKNLAEECATLKAQVAALSALAETDHGKAAGIAAPQASAINLQDEAQLGGREGVMFALADRPYNQRARAALLSRATGMQVMSPVASSMDFARLKEDLGAFYRIPWQERLQSLLMELPTITANFPLESGYQDMAVLVNVWLGEFSQADNTQSDFENVTKGAYEFGDEVLRMSDVMFAHKFKNLKEMEKTWIGYLNREGSQAIKWSFIEFILSETAKKLHNEREQRRVNGVRKNPQLNEPGRALEAADGVYEFIRKRVEGYKDPTSGNTVYQIKPFELGEINEGNIGEKVYQGTSLIPAVLRDSGSLRLYMPSRMLVLYHKYNEAKYGTHMDYTANINYVKEYPSVQIVEVPNADNHQRLIWTMDGNIRFYEDVPGEMLQFNIEQQDWTLKVWSNWKEGVAALAVGYKYASKADMDYERQMIFCNEIDMLADSYVECEKDKNPDVALHTSVKTVANTQLFAITDITSAEVGVPVTIMCGSVNYGVKIAKSGVFSLISAEWVPAKGDTITLVKRADGKFIEVKRTNAGSSLMQFAANDTTPSLAGATKFVTGENTAATAITNFDDAEVGVKYTIYGSGSTNASTIANSGNFVLTAAMTLSAGKSIELVKSTDGKFYEVSRA